MNKKAVITIIIISILTLSYLYISQYGGKKYDQTNILDVPGVFGEEKDKKNHFRAVVKLAEEAEYLEIGQCDPKPLVFKTTLGEIISVKNSGDKSVGFRMQIEGEFINIPSGESIQIDTSEHFFIGGVYGFFCNRRAGTVGFLYIED